MPRGDAVWQPRDWGVNPTAKANRHKRLMKAFKAKGAKRAKHLAFAAWEDRANIARFFRRGRNLVAQSAARNLYYGGAIAMGGIAAGIGTARDYFFPPRTTKTTRYGLATRPAPCARRPYCVRHNGCPWSWCHGFGKIHGAFPFPAGEE